MGILRGKEGFCLIVLFKDKVYQIIDTDIYIYRSRVERKENENHAAN